MKQILLVICAAFLIFGLSQTNYGQEIIWSETTQSDFADGFIDPNLYASHRSNLDATEGTVEWFPRFDIDGNGYPDFVSPDGRSPYYLRVWYMGPGGLIRQQNLYNGGSGGDADYA